MDQSNLQSFIQQAQKLTPIEQQLLIKILSSKNNDRPLTEKEKQFIEESKVHIKELQSIRNELISVIKKYE